MMNLVPQIYSDELLYSLLSRYKRMCGIVSRRALLQDLYGSQRVITSIFLPQYLKELTTNLPPYSRITVDELIMDHTMFPFYTAFLSKERSENIYRRMSDGSTMGVENAVGFAGGKVKPYNRLRYCPMCYEEDIKELGESFWRRLHQVPGVLYCLKHEVRLKNTVVLSTERWADYWCADGDVCDVSVEQDTYQEQIKKLNLEYIRNVVCLMGGGYKKKELSDLVRFYVDRLRDKRLASKNGSVYIQDFVEQFLHFYPAGYLSLMQSQVDVDQKASWLRLVFVNQNVDHPANRKVDHLGHNLRWLPCS